LSLLHSILHTYAQFFELSNWSELLRNPSDWGLILTLVILEGLLSADNALVLAIMVKHLPPEKRKKALMYGLWGAYLFRFIFIGLGTTLAKFWFIKLIGAGYLLWISIKFFKEKLFSKDNAEGDLDGDGEVDEGEKIAKGWLARQIGVFWATVASIELMDLSFSADSILAALAVSDKVVILLLGGMLGILMMRGIATIFVKLIEAVPELEYTAFVLIALIGLKMGLTVFFPHSELLENHTIFFSVIGVSFLITFIIHFIKKPKHA
jgi:YkoY family integral membrane protein